MRHEPPEPQPYDSKYVQELMKEEGCTWEEAVLIASSTMDGAYEESDGGINAYQTACQVLNYNEAAPSSNELDSDEFEDPVVDDSLLDQILDDF